MGNQEQHTQTPLTDARVAEYARDGFVVMRNLTLHESCPNPSGRDRWCAIATYRDAGQKDSSTVWCTSIVLSGESVNL